MAAVSGDHDCRITDLTNVTVHESVAVRTANTGTNGHGVSVGCAHTIDGANGQAVGVDFYNGATTGESTKTLNCAATDKGLTGGVIVRGQSFDGGFGFPTERDDVSCTLHNNTCPGHCNGVTIATNSNGCDVMPTISRDEYKMAQKQKDNGGGGGTSSSARSRMMSGNFDMYDMADGGDCVSLNARRAYDTMIVEGK